MDYQRNIDELQPHAIMWWSEELAQQNADISIIPQLLKSQDDFLRILSLATDSPEQVFSLIAAAKFRINLFLKHLCVLADYGGEPLQRLGRSFTDIFPENAEGGRQLDYTWNGENYTYTFQCLPATLGNTQLKIDGKGLSKSLFEVTPLYQDVVMLLMHGATSQASEEAALSKCEIGSLIGSTDALESYVKQRYIAVSRITGGATANSLGQLAQSNAAEQLKEFLGEVYTVTSNGKIFLDGYDKGEMPFDIVVESSNSKFGIEISFQVTTNSTIERKAGQSADRERLMHENGYWIAYVIDGAGNFQRRSAVSAICNHSDCTVAYSTEEFEVLANWIKEKDA